MPVIIIIIIIIKAQIIDPVYVICASIVTGLETFTIFLKKCQHLGKKPQIKLNSREDWYRHQ